MKKIMAMLTLVSTLCLGNVAFAQEASPYKVIKNVGQNLFNRIAQEHQEISKFPHLMRNIVDEELMPHVDYKYAAYKILGKNLRSSSKEQRKNFVTAMRKYLVRTYANALTQYDNQDVIYEAEKATNNKKIVAVTAQIIDEKRPAIDIVFKLRQNKKTKEWKAFDMVVEGISLLSSKQAELSKRIAKEGLDDVTLALASIAK